MAVDKVGGKDGESLTGVGNGEVEVVESAIGQHERQISALLGAQAQRLKAIQDDRKEREIEERKELLKRIGKVMDLLEKARSILVGPGNKEAVEEAILVLRKLEFTPKEASSIVGKVVDGTEESAEEIVKKVFQKGPPRR